MSVFLPQRPEFLKAKLKESSAGSRRAGGVLCSDTLNTLRSQLRAELCDGDASTPIILTGHQPIFYHPGILIKDLLADALARSIGGVALNMVVDTDEAELVFDYPFPDGATGDGRAVTRKRFVLAPPGGMLRELQFSSAQREAFVTEIHAYLPRVRELFGEQRAAETREWLEVTCLLGSRSRSVMEPAVRLREEYESRLGLSIKTIYASDLVQTEAFRYFTDFILEHRLNFRTAYNAVLDRYRLEHGIKNPAQPMANLEYDELPFWRLEGDRRLTLRDRDAGAPVVFPKAIALTLFCRLFLCDLFIHGRGGARYDVVTDRLLENFFECPGAPFTVASATLTMSGRPEYPVEARSLADIERDVRSYQFEPTRFLPPDHVLRRRHADLVAERQIPGANLARIHADFLALAAEARVVVGEVPGRLDRERALSALALRNRAVFHDRTFPFFFYDLGSLFEAVRPYGPPDSN